MSLLNRLLKRSQRPGFFFAEDMNEIPRFGWLEYASLAEAHPAPAADHEVVEQLDAQGLPASLQPPGESNVVLARFGISRRMVVGQDEGCRIHGHRRPEHFPGMHRSRVQRTHGHDPHVGGPQRRGAVLGRRRPAGVPEERRFGGGDQSPSSVASVASSHAARDSRNVTRPPP